MTQPILDRIRAGHILVSDGAMGTQLQQRGMPAGHCPDEYNVSHPEVVQAIHRDYYRAGADVVSTNSFGGNRARLARHGCPERVAEFAAKSVEIIKAVCPPGRYIAGDIGPTGELMEPFGDLTEDQVFKIYVEQCEALAKAGVDLLLIETMMAIQEAVVAVRAACSTGLPVGASMTFESRGDEFRTSWGVSIPEAVSSLAEAGASIIGSNCGQGFDEMLGIVKCMKGLTHLPIIAQANAGLPEWVDGRPVYKETPETVAPKAARLVEAGVNIIGGCCGTTPAHIAEIRKVVDARR